MPKASKEKVMERIAYIISLLSEGGKRPIELKRELKVDYATVMRYLNYLRKKGVVEKTLDRNGRIIYKIASHWQDHKKFLRMYFEAKKDKMKIFSKAKKLGIFDKGIDEKGILKSLGWDIQRDLTLYELVSFLGNLIDVVGPVKIVKIKLRLSELDEKTERRLEKLRKLFEKYFGEKL